MSALANRDFVKMNGLGNEIVIVDLRRAPGPIRAGEARAAARPGALRPADGALSGATAGTDASIRIYNNDGSEAGACGNGMRCVAALVSAETGKAELTFETTGRPDLLLAGRRAACSRSIWAGRAFAGTKFRWREEFPDTRAIDLAIGPRDAPVLHSPSVVSMGNPHAIFWVDDPQAYDLRKIGPLLENHPMFPERANITLAATPSRDHIVIRTWERGAGLTKACGSAACAAAVAAARLGRTGRKVTVTLPGGDLAIEWRESDDHVLMTGPVEYEHKGRFDAALFAGRGRGSR